MWEQVTVPFAKLLGQRLYPSLFRNSDYQEFLHIAGIKPPYPHDISGLSTSQQKRLAEYAHLRSNLLSLELNGLQALDEAHGAAITLSGPQTIYRLCNAADRRSDLRFFWFSEQLLQESLQAGKQKKDREEWLRAQLAVAYNWSPCDRIVRLTLKSRDAIPAVQANGLPIRAVRIGTHDTTVKLPADYFQRYTKYSSVLPGGVPQLFLYLVPEDAVTTLW